MWNPNPRWKIFSRRQAAEFFQRTLYTIAASFDAAAASLDAFFLDVVPSPPSSSSQLLGPAPPTGLTLPTPLTSDPGTRAIHDPALSCRSCHPHLPPRWSCFLAPPASLIAIHWGAPPHPLLSVNWFSTRHLLNCCGKFSSILRKLWFNDHLCIGRLLRAVTH
jgi:hypothetical protein